MTVETQPILVRQLPSYSAGDYGEALVRLAPRGRAWSRDTDAVWGQVIRAQGGSYSRLHARANYLLTDSFPSTAVELLPEWEASVGLPDPCAGPDQTIAQRQAHVVARLTQQNGPSIPSLTAFAATLGYAITIQEFAPARYGRPNYGQPRYGKAWAFAWQVTTDSVTITPAVYGEHRYGEPYRTWGGDVLECEMNRIKPAHTILVFNYTGTPLGALWTIGAWGRDAWNS